jgi:hypothetical protein
MAIDPEKFIEWAESRFDSVVVKGEEVQINSPFTETEDTKHKLWCNPYGGKKDIENGVFHCWKTDKKGSLASLVMIVDKCDFPTAMQMLGGEDMKIRRLEQKLEELFSKKWKKKEDNQELEEEEFQDLSKLEIPPFCPLISELPSSNFHRSKAESYLKGRKLEIGDLRIGTSGDYRERIVIPYYDRYGKLIYFNSRYIGDKDYVLRYKGPHKSIGVGKEDVLYMPEWPKVGSKIYLTEGEFDALSIYKANMFAGAFGGKNLSEKQIEMLRPYHPVLALDTDKAGKDGLSRMAQFLKTKGFDTISFIRPPKKFKDWNAMLQEVGTPGIIWYINKNEKILDDMYLVKLLS